MDREMKALVKKSKNNNQAKYKNLQREFDEYKKKNDVKVSVVLDLRKENERLREALKFYAEEYKYEDNISTTYGYTCEIAYDEGKTARQALEGEYK